MSRTCVLLLGLLLASTGCSSSTPSTVAEPTVTTAPTSPVAEVSPSPSPAVTESPDPYAVPDEIDVTYVQRVIEALDPVWSRMMQAFVDSGSLDDPRRVELSLAVMTGVESADFAQDWSDLLEQMPDALDNVRDPVGLPTTTVDEVVQADDSCIVARVQRTHEDVYVEDDPAEGMQAWIVLERAPAEGPEAQYVAEHNPTPWRYAVLDEYTTSTTPEEGWC